MLGKIADRKDRLLHMEKKLATLDRTRLGKEVGTYALPNHPRSTCAGGVTRRDVLSGP